MFCLWWFPRHTGELSWLSVIWSTLELLPSLLWYWTIDSYYIVFQKTIILYINSFYIFHLSSHFAHALTSSCLHPRRQTRCAIEGTIGPAATNGHQSTRSVPPTRKPAYPSSISDSISDRRSAWNGPQSLNPSNFPVARSAAVIGGPPEVNPS